MFICYVNEADLGTMAFVAYFAPWFSKWHMSFRVYREQHPCPRNTTRWFRQFLVIYRCLDKGGGLCSRHS